MVVLIGLPIAIASLNAIIGCYVFYKNPRSITHRAFFVVAVGIAGWIFGIILIIATGHYIFVALTLWSGELTVIGFMIFAQTFPDDRPWRIPFLFWLPWIVIFVCTPFRWFIADVTFNARGYLEPNNGPLFFLFAMVMASYISASFYRLSITWSESHGIRRVQMRYFLLGTGIFLVAAVLFDIILPAFGIFFLNLIGPLASIAFVGCAAYAIIQHQFLDIRVIIKRSITYFATIAAVAAIFFGIEFAIEKFFYNDEAVDIAAAIIGAFIFSWIKSFFGRITDRIFFRADYDYAEAVRDLGPILNATIELRSLMAAIDEFLARTIKPAKVFFWVDHTEESLLFSHQASDDAVRQDRELYKKIIATGVPPTRRVFILQEVKAMRSTETLRSYGALVEELGFGAVVPLFANDVVVGIVLLGEKLSDDIFRTKDIELLSVLSHQGGMAIENARLYDSIRRNKQELEDIVEARIKEVREMYHVQEQFVTDISHQLQTPIAILEGNLELAEHRPVEQTKNSLRTMRDTLDGMAHLVSSFLEIARLNFSKNKFREEWFDVAVLLRDTHEDCLVLAETKGVRLECSTEKAMTVGDRRKIKEVVLNLLSNALKHTEANGTIWLQAIKSETCAQIVVRDTGSGIAPENLSHIFERFYRIPGTGTHGTGLGLNICREIIEAHGGTISAVSTVGEGTTFTVCLPLAPELDTGASAIL